MRTYIVKIRVDGELITSPRLKSLKAAKEWKKKLDEEYKDTRDEEAVIWVYEA